MTQLDAIIRNQLNRDECDEDTPELLVRRKQQNADQGSIMAAVGASKIEDSKMKAAIRILTSDDKPAPNLVETLLNLQDNHPRTAAYNHLRLDNNQHKPLHVTEADILQAIRSFTAGSSGGLDGLRTQHILELMMCKEISMNFSSITAFTNMLLEGKCHDEVSPNTCRMIRSS